jgi:hypothetical protein
MADHVERPTPSQAAAALDSIEHMALAATRRGLRSRWFAMVASLWGGAIAVATAYDGPLATRAIAALVLGGFLGLALLRRRILVRVRSVEGAVGAAFATALIVGVLVVGLLGARAFETYGLSWVPFASGGVVAALLFIMLEILRRTTQSKLMAG